MHRIRPGVSTRYQRRRACRDVIQGGDRVVEDGDGVGACGVGIKAGGRIDTAGEAGREVAKGVHTHSAEIFRRRTKLHHPGGLRNRTGGSEFVGLDAGWRSGPCAGFLHGRAAGQRTAILAEYRNRAVAGVERDVIVCRRAINAGRKPACDCRGCIGAGRHDVEIVLGAQCERPRGIGRQPAEFERCCRARSDHICRGNRRDILRCGKAGLRRLLDGDGIGAATRVGAGCSGERGIPSADGRSQTGGRVVQRGVGAGGHIAVLCSTEFDRPDFAGSDGPGKFKGFRPTGYIGQRIGSGRRRRGERYGAHLHRRTAGENGDRVVLGDRPVLARGAGNILGVDLRGERRGDRDCSGPASAGRVRVEVRAPPRIELDRPGFRTGKPARDGDADRGLPVVGGRCRGCRKATLVERDRECRAGVLHHSERPARSVDMGCVAGRRIRRQLAGELREDGFDGICSRRLVPVVCRRSRCRRQREGVYVTGSSRWGDIECQGNRAGRRGRGRECPAFKMQVEIGFCIADQGQGVARRVHLRLVKRPDDIDLACKPVQY